MKKLIALLLALTMVLSMSACSLFAGPDIEGAQGTAEGSIEITDSYTYEDPADLTFDDRHVIYDPNGVMAETYAQMGYTIENNYLIVYAVEEKAVQQREILVFKTAEEASAYAEEMKAQGSELEVQGNVTLSAIDNDTLEAYIMALVSYGMLADDKASTYVNYYVDAAGMVKYPGE